MAEGMRAHELFITDVEYATDEVQLGQVYTGTPGSPAPSTTINCGGNLATEYADLQHDSILRFVSTTTTTVTDYMMVRSLVRTATTLTLTVDAPVTLANADVFRIYLVRRWFPRPVALRSRFKHVKSVQVVAFAFTGIDGGNLYEGITGTPQHDYIGLEIKELPGKVVSTNRWMDGMLAVLPTKMSAYHPSSWNDARDGMIYLPESLGRTCYEQPLQAISELTPRLVNRRGDTIRAARFHLWLRIWARD